MWRLSKDFLLIRELHVHGDENSSPFLHTMFCPQYHCYRGNTTEIIPITAVNQSTVINANFYKAVPITPVTAVKVWTRSPLPRDYRGR